MPVPTKVRTPSGLAPVGCFLKDGGGMAVVVELGKYTSRSRHPLITSRPCRSRTHTVAPLQHRASHRRLHGYMFFRLSLLSFRFLPCELSSTNPSAWQARVRYHDMRGRPIHSKRVLEWNGLYVLYDLHFPPGASLPSSATSNSVSSTTSSSGGSEGEEGLSRGLLSKSSFVVPCTRIAQNTK